MPDEKIQVETEELPAAAAAWRAGVPTPVTYPEVPSGVEDVASAGVLGAIAHWPAEHTAMTTQRKTAASKLETAATATTAILRSSDQDGATGVTASLEV
jgi:hypothetical protein